MKRFSSVGQAFETPMEGPLYKLVQGPLTELLGGTEFSTGTTSSCGYTVGKREESRRTSREVTAASTLLENAATLITPSQQKNY